MVPVSTDGRTEMWTPCFSEGFSTEVLPAMARSIAGRELDLLPQNEVVLETDGRGVTIRISTKKPSGDFFLGRKVLVRESDGTWGYDPRPPNP